MLKFFMCWGLFIFWDYYLLGLFIFESYILYVELYLKLLLRLHMQV